MIQVKMEHTKYGFTLKMTGHAEHVRKEGSANLCCAGATMLGTTAAEVLASMQDHGKLRDFRAYLGKGRTFIRVAALRPHLRDVRVLESMLRTGLELLCERYPDRILMG